VTKPVFDRNSLTSTLAQLAATQWDVVILGAGVAGAAASILASQQGLRALLIESKIFPREKVCGGCLNARAQASLHRLGILVDLQREGAVNIHAMRVQIKRSIAQWPIPKMLSVRRSTLDRLLVEKGVATGAVFVDGTRGTLIPNNETSSPTRHIRLQRSKESVTVESRTVLIASGLTRSSLQQQEAWPATVEPTSRIGVQCLVPSTFDHPLADGRLHMIVGSAGYVGLCKTDGDCIDVAAALDKRIVQSIGISETVQTILTENGWLDFPLPVEREAWLATPALTRRSQKVSEPRVFLIGDSIGYVEPFTGEGMSWALASAEAVLPFVQEAIGSDPLTDPLTDTVELADRWSRWTRKQAKVHATCEWIAKSVRHTRSASVVLQACNWIRPLRASLIHRTTQ
jgi:menaquinone-9 beta-reductase